MFTSIGVMYLSFLKSSSRLHSLSRSLRYVALMSVHSSSSVLRFLSKVTGAVLKPCSGPCQTQRTIVILELPPELLRLLSGYE